jgi:hypothetical protein
MQNRARTGFSAAHFGQALLPSIEDEDKPLNPSLPIRTLLYSAAPFDGS